MQCRECAELGSDEAWRELPLVRVMRAAELVPIVTRWTNRAIEVRACPRCGREIARVAQAVTS
jgi:hypothetical protein